MTFQAIQNDCSLQLDKEVPVTILSQCYNKILYAGNFIKEKKIIYILVLEIENLRSSGLLCLASAEGSPHRTANGITGGASVRGKERVARQEAKEREGWFCSFSITHSHGPTCSFSTILIPSTHAQCPNHHSARSTT